ncbi:4-amino-4-deoxy-L-arabinose transferase-like glycosyltransferase [Azospirillum brasilense]|uniref:4-amino-4-deoxy-L-arabinose transferase-like glycosyltransferase n=1 Tax=Azospirillum brasilense TaxID=192 RepID=A0A560AK24_AZOBR|nr:glycosyltransferase family 39 protein [Azospirillum brasilense]TWA60696.1 4-amino-4-deoxy-L-arabinose transferase-like glycosyltransferase [Azospirillum brasilense]
MSAPPNAAAGRLPALAYLALAVISVLLFLPGFFDLPPFDRDEARFAQASHQMLESGDYVDIRFQDEARHKKPVGIYWLQTAATRLVEGSGAVPKEIWTFRIPSLIGAVLAVLATAWTGARMFGGTVGFLAGLMMASCVVLGVEARMAKTDAVLLATIVIGQAALASLYLNRHAERSGWAAPLAFWIAAGIGILIKGPIVLLVSGTTALTLAVLDRRAGWLRRLRPLVGLAIVVAIAAPWLIAITVKTKGAFFAESVGHDMMGKVVGGQEAKGLPPGYYLGTFWVTFAPWSFLALLAVPWAWRHRKGAGPAADAVRFCIAWIVPSWLVFEAVPTKLLHYTLPVFPAIAILTAAAAREHFLRRADAPRRGLFWAATVLGAVGFGALTIAVAVIPYLVDGRVDPVAVAMLPVVLVLYALAVRLFAQRRETHGFAAGLAAAAVLYAGTYGAVLPGIDGVWISRQAARTVAAARPCADSVVASAGYSEPSLVFLLGTGTRLTHGTGAAAHLAENPSCGLALVTDREEAEFRAALKGAEPVPLGRFTGFNYNTGKRLTLTLYGAPRP